MIDLKLDGSHNAVVQDGDLALVRDAEEVAQFANICLLTVLGECYYDFTKGVDWEKFFSMETSYEQKKKIVKDAIRSAPGFLSFKVFQFNMDAENQTAEINYVADTIYGPIIVKAGKKS